MSSLKDKFKEWEEIRTSLTDLERLIPDIVLPEVKIFVNGFCMVGTVPEQTDHPVIDWRLTAELNRNCGILFCFNCRFMGGEVYFYPLGYGLPLIYAEKNCHVDEPKDIFPCGDEGHHKNVVCPHHAEKFVEIADGMIKEASRRIEAVVGANIDAKCGRETLNLFQEARNWQRLEREKELELKTMKAVLNRVFNALPTAIDALVKSKSFAKSATLKDVREILQRLHGIISEIIAPVSNK